MAVDLVVPEVGESITEVEIGKWLVAEGDAVEKDQPLVEIETDKVTLELPAPQSGTIFKITHAQGAEAAVGDKIGEMDGGEAGAAKTGEEKESKREKQAEAEGETEGETERRAATATKQPEAEQAKQQASEQPSRETTEDDGKGDRESKDKGEDKGEDKNDRERRIMPAAQRMIDEHGLDPARIEATGPGARLLKEDVQNFLDRQGGESRAPQKTTGNGKPAAEDKRSPLRDDAVPPPAFAEPAHEPAEAERRSSDHAAAQRSEAGGNTTPQPTGARGEEVVPMTPMRRRIASRLVEAQQTAALLTTFNECDMTEVMNLRSQYKEAFEKKYGIKLGFMSFFVKGVVDALLQYPQVGAEVRGTDIVFKNYIDIGIAVGTGKGLVVPVLRDADQKSFADVENTIADFGKRAQAGKLALDELQGGTFTITNGGIFGSMLSTPIINPPQAAVLGMHAIQRRPTAVGTPGKDERIEIRPMMNLALSYDHRLIDGREAVTFLKRIKDTIEQPTRMLMEV